MADPALADPRLIAIKSYIDTLLAARSKATTPAAADAIDEQIDTADDLSQQIMAELTRSDDGQLGQIKTAIDAENKKLQAFKSRVSAIISDVGIAAKVVGGLAEIAHLIPGL